MEEYKMLVSELKKLKLQNELITLRRTASDEDITGTVEFINKEVTVICQYTDEGEYDGYAVFYTGQIYEVLWGNREHKGIAALVAQYGKKAPFKATGDSFVKLLQSLNDNYNSLSVYTDGGSSFDLARIEKMSGDWLKINSYGPKKSLSGLTKLIQFEDIERIDVDSPYQNRIVELHNMDALAPLNNKETAARNET